MRNISSLVAIFIIVFAITLTALNIGVAIGFNVSSAQLRAQKFSKNDITYSSRFGDALRDAALEKTGLFPIEGYSAQILLNTFPGLYEQDFEGVEALQGIYFYESDTIEFLRQTGVPIHTAEKTISNIGMETLYRNLKQRHSLATIEQVIEKISIPAKNPVEDGFLMVKKEVRWGPCPSDDPEECHETTELWSNGELFDGGQWIELHPDEFEVMTNMIFGTGILYKDCSYEGFITDYWAAYTINDGSQERIIKFPGCEDELKIINTALGLYLKE